MKKIVVLLAAVAVIASCKTTKKTTANADKAPSGDMAMNESDAQRGAVRFPELTLEKLHQGKILNEKFCNMCHGLKKHENYTEEQLKKIVPGMVGKVNKKTGTASIDATAQELLLQYLVTMGPLKK